MSAMTRCFSIPTFITAAALGAGLGSVASVPSAHAQAIRVSASTAGGMMGQDYTPSINRSRFERYAKVLGLEGDLKFIASTLVDQYLAEFREAANESRSRSRDLNEEAMATQDFSVFSREMPKIVEAWTKKREELDARLIDDLRSILSDEQQPRWTIVERERRRHMLLPKGRLSGESIDLIELVEGTRLEDSFTPEQIAELIDPVLEQYAIELDSALQTRDRLIEPLQRKFFETLANDRTEAEKIWKDATDRRKVVRDINRKYLQILAATLGDDLGVRLHDRFMTTAYPNAFGPTRADKYIESAKNSDLLDEEQIQRLEALSMSMESKLDPMRRQIAKLTDEQDEGLPPWMQMMNIEGGSARGGMVMTFGGSDQGNDPMRDLLRERFQIVRDVMEQVERTLTDDQRQAIPRPEAEADMFRNIRMGGTLL